VSLGVDLETGRKFAIKRLHVEVCLTSDRSLGTRCNRRLQPTLNICAPRQTDNVFQMTQVIREVKLMKHLRGHQNVLLIEDVILTPSVGGRLPLPYPPAARRS
jgi:hypothetical protein